MARLVVAMRVLIQKPTLKVTDLSRGNAEQLNACQYRHDHTKALLSLASGSFFW